MIREVVKIDEEKCNGCGLCVPACHEGAIKIVNGKARLVEDRLCDGLGACLGHCPQDAITIEQPRRRRVQRGSGGFAPGRQAHAVAGASIAMSGGCPGSQFSPARACTWRGMPVVPLCPVGSPATPGVKSVPAEPAGRRQN